MASPKQVRKMDKVMTGKEFKEHVFGPLQKVSTYPSTRHNITNEKNTDSLSDIVKKSDVQAWKTFSPETDDIGDIRISWKQAEVPRYLHNFFSIITTS